MAYLLPDYLLSYFELSSVERYSEVLHLYLQEKNYSPEEISEKGLLSKGFLPEITIQDFPIREHRVFLHVRRRRWLNTQTGQVEQRDWKEVSQGTRMTTDFAAFLKEIDGFIPPQYQ